jgi:hypothetical protein
MSFKLGRKPASFSAPKMRASLNLNAILATFGAPPPSSAPFMAPVKRALGMYLNDQLGCCVASDTAHGRLIRSSNTGKVVIPTDDDVLKLYEAVGGYVPGDPSTDQGCNESDMCKYLMTTGFLGEKCLGTAPVVAGSITSMNNLKWACQIFIGVRLGVNLPASAEPQFDAGQPWDIGGDETIVGGHDVGMVTYDPHHAYVTTWGKAQPVTYAWLQKFVEEAHVEIWPDSIRANGMTPAGFHLATLERDLTALAS